VALRVVQGALRPKVMNKAEVKDEIYEKELLAVYMHFVAYFSGRYTPKS
jgi:hypothetical protein